MFIRGTGIFITWDPITTDTLSVLGYKLYADTGKNDALRLIYDGSTNPQLTEYEFTALDSFSESIQTSLFYRF